MPPEQPITPDEIDAAKVRLFRNRVLRWAREHGRHFPWRRAGEPLYRLVVTEVLLQQTKAETVATVYDQLFAKYPNWRSLASADLDELTTLLRRTGLWRRRPARLIAFAQRMNELGGQLPKTREELEELPCVGQYVASAALLFQGVSNEPLLDVGMARVLERFFGPRKLADIRYDPYLQVLARNAVACEEAVDTNWAILDLSALICRPKAPRCEICPVREVCRYRRRTTPTEK